MGILQSWYSKKEYQAFMKDVNLTLEAFPYLQKKKDSLSRIDKKKLKSICIRGAERPRIILKMQTRKLIVQSIIQQQKINRENKPGSASESMKKRFSDDEIIRQLSLMISKKSRDMAIQLAVIDANTVKCY